MKDDCQPALSANAQRLLRLLDRLRPQMQSPAFRRLSELQLSHSHVRVLRILSDEHAVAMKELAEHLQLTPPSVTALSRRLVQTGLVERLPHADDSRVTLLALTGEGRELHRQLHAAHLERIGRLLAGLAPAEQEQFLDLFERAIRFADGEPAPAGPEIRPAAEAQALDPDAT